MLYENTLRAENYSERTISSYTVRARSLVAFLQREFGFVLSDSLAQNLSAAMLTSYYNSFAGLSDATRNQYVEATRSFLNFLSRKLGFQLRDDLAYRALKNVRVHVDEEENDKKRYAADEKVALADSVEASSRGAVRNAAIVALLLGSGLRVSELCNLNCGSAIELMQNGWFYCIRKGGNRRKVAVSAQYMPPIKRYFAMRDLSDPAAPLFPSERGNRMSRELVYHMLSRHQKKLGLKTGPHVLRHNFISSLASSGNDVDIVRRAADHSSIVTTQGYMHASEDERIQAIQNLRP